MSVNLPFVAQPRVVIVGCGFAGLRLAQDLAQVDVQVVLLDRNNYHNFQPLLYQVATGALEADSIAYPIRKVFAGQQNFAYRLADVQRVDADRRVVVTSIGEVAYDYLVLATGSRTNFFGIKSIEQNALQIKSVPHALNLRSFIFQNFERAMLADSPEERQALLTIVIAGGGPTGVELSGSLAEMRRDVLPADYPELDLRQMEIYLVEAAPVLLGPMSAKSQANAKAYLEKAGVRVRLNTPVKRYEDGKVYTSDTEFIRTENLIWAAGVSGTAVPGLPPTAVARNQTIQVNAWNQVLGQPRIFAIGDVASMVSAALPKGYPMLSPVAMQQASQLAKNLQRLLRGEEPKDFTYFNKGVMAIIGRNRALADLPGNVHFKGFLGWLSWLFIHLVYLVGFRNKLVALTDWAFSYFGTGQALRLIIRPYQRFDYAETHPGKAGSPPAAPEPAPPDPARAAK